MLDRIGVLDATGDGPLAGRADGAEQPARTSAITAHAARHRGVRLDQVTEGLLYCGAKPGRVTGRSGDLAQRADHFEAAPVPA